ncbi:hypothetical protein U1Q18_008333 [Sarracenia purpurea var. burkii]
MFLSPTFSSSCFSSFPVLLSFLPNLVFKTLEYAVGMTKLCYLSNITGRKHLRRGNHINSSGIRWTKLFETRTISTGVSTSRRFFFSLLFGDEI